MLWANRGAHLALPTPADERGADRGGSRLLPTLLPLDRGVRVAGQQRVRLVFF